MWARVRLSVAPCSGQVRIATGTAAYVGTRSTFLSVILAMLSAFRWSMASQTLCPFHLLAATLLKLWKSSTKNRTCSHVSVSTRYDEEISYLKLSLICWFASFCRSLSVELVVSLGTCLLSAACRPLFYLLFISRFRSVACNVSFIPQNLPDGWCKNLLVVSPGCVWYWFAWAVSA